MHTTKTATSVPFGNKYFRNGNVEANTGISLLAESGKFDVIDSATPTNVVFKELAAVGVHFFPCSHYINHYISHFIGH